MLTHQLLTKEQVAEIYYNHMQADFPPDEVKPLEVLHRLMEKGLYMPYGWFEDGELRAYSFFVRANGGKTLLMDYYAVCRGYRSHGYGGKCLAQMQELFRGIHGIIAEVEDPAKSRDEAELQTRTRRVAFYQRNGLRPSEVRSVLFGVPYVLHYFPVDSDITDDELFQALDDIYHTLFPQPIYDKNARIWMAESEA